MGRRSGLGLQILAITGFVLSLHRLAVRAFSSYDLHHDGYMYHVAMSVKHGYRPHVDVFAQYGFIKPTLDCIWLILFNERAMALKFGSLVMVVAAVSLVMAMAKNLGRESWIAPVIGTTWLLLSDVFLGAVYLSWVTIEVQVALLMILYIFSNSAVNKKPEDIDPRTYLRRVQTFNRAEFGKKVIMVLSFMIVLDGRPVVYATLIGLLCVWAVIERFGRWPLRGRNRTNREFTLRALRSSRSADPDRVRSAPLFLIQIQGYVLAIYALLIVILFGGGSDSGWVFDRLKYPYVWAPSSRAAELFPNFLKQLLVPSLFFAICLALTYSGMRYWLVAGNRRKRLFAPPLIMAGLSIGAWVFDKSATLTLLVPIYVNKSEVVGLANFQIVVLFSLWWLLVISSLVPLARYIVSVLILVPKILMIRVYLAKKVAFTQANKLRQASTSRLVGCLDKPQIHKVVIFSAMVAVAALVSVYPVIDNRHLWFVALLTLSGLWWTTPTHRARTVKNTRLLIVALLCVTAWNVVDLMKDTSDRNLYSGHRVIEDFDRFYQFSSTVSRMSRFAISTDDGFWLGLAQPSGSKVHDSISWAQLESGKTSSLPSSQNESDHSCQLTNVDAIGDGDLSNKELVVLVLHGGNVALSCPSGHNS